MLNLVEEVHKDFKKVRNIHELQDFHGRQKFLYFCYHISTKNTLGSLASKGDLEGYERALKRIFTYKRTRNKERNALEHMVGYLKKELTPEEKDTFRRLLAGYTSGRDSLGNILLFLHKKATEHKIDYLLKQSIFRIGDIT